jgi:hypothetical protein
MADVAQPTRMRWKLLLVLTGAALVFAGEWVAFALKPYSELPLYLRAGERLRRGEPIYRKDERAFTYPPLFAVPFVPFALLPGWAHRPLWYLINAAALAVIGWRLHRRLLPGLVPADGRWAVPYGAFWLLALVLAGRHLIAPLENQSHDLLLFLCIMLAVDAWCAGRDRSAGFAAGLGAALKATPLLFAPFLLWQRRFAACAVLLLTLAAFMFLPDLLFPARDGVSWTVSWYRTFLTSVQPGESATSTAWRTWNQLNQSVPGTLYRLFTPLVRPDPDQFDVCLMPLSRPALKGITLAAQFAILGWLVWVTLPGRSAGLDGGARQFHRLGEGAALVTAMVLLSPTSIKTHFCVLLLPIAFCLADFLYRRRDVWVGAALALAFVLGTLTVKGVIGRAAGDHIMTYGSVTACGLALYLATGRVLLQRARQRQTECRSAPPSATLPRAA